MFRVLIVEDTPAKLARVSKAILDVEGATGGMIRLEHASDIRAAKLLLKDNYFELLVLDIVLPMRKDEEPNPKAGALLLDELSRREDRYKMPGHIIGITQFADVYDEALARFQELTLSVVPYEEGSDAWIKTLQAGVRFVLSVVLSRTKEQTGYRSEAAIVCALVSPELSAVKNLPWGFEPFAVDGDDTPYYSGEIPRSGMPQRKVFAAAAPRMGMQAAAVLAAKMIYNFRPRYLLCCGITAGLRGRTRPGDILAIDPSWDWGSGKWTIRDGEPEFQQSPHQIGLSPFFRGIIQQIATDSKVLGAIQDGWPGEPVDYRLSLHLGPVASGASVVADKSKLDEIVDQNRQILGIEMETYGIYLAAEEAPEPRPRALALKAVVDHADAKKTDGWQRYAAFVSARLMQHVLERAVP
jgi:nucleoside phosphorylase